MAGQGWHLVTAFLLYAFLARRLGPSLFGHWRVVLSVLAWFEIFITAGVSKVTTKAISEAPQDRHRVARAGYLGQAAVGAAVFVGIQLAAGLAAGLLGDPGLAPLLRIAALDVPLYAVFMAASAVVLGTQRFERQAIAWLVYATSKMLAIATLVAVGFSVPGALVGNALSSAVGFAAIVVPLGGARTQLRELASLGRGMLVAAVPFLTISLVEGVGQSVDLWTVSAVITNGVFVGLYAAATVLAEIPTFLFLGLNRVIFPAVARAHAEGDMGLVGHYATQGLRVALIVTALAVALMAATGKQALTLAYSAAYVGAFFPLVLLVVAGLGRTVRTTCTEVLMAGDRRKDSLMVLGGTVALEAVLLAALTPRYGILGAAAAAAGSALIAAAWGVATLGRLLEPKTLTTLARSTVAGVVVAAALWALHPTSVALVAAYPVAAAAYGGVLFALGEFRRGDLASLRRVVGR